MKSHCHFYPWSLLSFPASEKLLSGALRVCTLPLIKSLHIASVHSVVVPSACSLHSPELGTRAFPSFNDCLAFLSIKVPVLTHSVPKLMAIEVTPALCHYMCEDEFLKKELLYVCVCVILRESAKLPFYYDLPV